LKFPIINTADECLLPRGPSSDSREVLLNLILILILILIYAVAVHNTSQTQKSK